MADALKDRTASQWCQSRDSEQPVQYTVPDKGGAGGERESVSGKKDNTQTSKRLLHHPASQTLTPRYVLLL